VGVRVGLVLLVVAAVVVPTALISGRSASARGFSVQQVLRVFNAAGIR
jgi:hypothetical protein